MDLLLVKQQKVWAHCFHPDRQHIFYLVEAESTKGLVIIEEELISKSQINTFVVPKGCKASSGYILNYCKKMQVLVLCYPPNNLCIWNTQNKQLLLACDCHGKKPYLINSFAISELYSCFFFSAHGQRNLYYFHVQEAISVGYIQQYGKLKFPKKTHVFDIQTHPIDPRIACACSDGLIRLWNYGKMIALKSLHEPDYQKQVQNSLEGQVSSYFVCINISNDGQKLLAGTNTGKIYCWDGRTIGSKNILLASIRVSEKGVLALNWFNYNGEINTDHFICYNSEGNIKLLEIKLSKTMQQIREKWQNQEEKCGKITEIQSLQHTQTEVSNYNDICVSKLLEAHLYNNMISFFIVKSRQIQENQISYQFQQKVFQLQDKNNPQSEYPVISEQYPHSFQELIPDQNRNVMFQNQIFFIENYEIKSFSMAMGLLKNVLNLQQPLLCEELKFTSLSFRPLGLGYVEEGKFLACFKSDGNNRMCCVRTKIDEVNNSILSFKEIPCSQSFFLGGLGLKNPPIYLLEDSRMGYQIYIDTEVELDEEIKEILQDRGNVANGLSYKIQRVYQTPMRKGFVVIYQTSNENVFRLSKNQDPDVDILDFGVESDITCRLDSSETIIDVQCNMVKDDVCLIAVICLNRVYFLDSSLRIIHKYKIISNLSTNMIIQGKWFGPCLLLMTKTHLHYMTLQGDSEVLCSSDNINTKQLIGMTMIDRILIMSKENQKKNIDIKVKGFSILEPLILGYLSLCTYFEEKPNEKYITKIIECYKSNRISQKLIDGLCEFQLNLHAHFLMMQDESRQFTAFSKVKLSKIIGKMDSFMDLIFPGRNLEDSGVYMEIVNKLAYDPRYVAKKKILQNLEVYFLNIGDYQNMVQVSSILGNFDKILYVAKLTGNSELENSIKDQIFNSQQGKQYHKIYRYGFLQDKEQCSSNNAIEKFQGSVKMMPLKDVNFDPILQKKIMGNFGILDALNLQFGSQKLKTLQKKLFEIEDQEELKFGEIGFGEDNFSQIYHEKPDEDNENEENIQKVNNLVIDNVQQYIGLYSEYREAKEGGQGQQNQEQGEANDPFADQFDNDEDEFKDLVILWRFGNGKGSSVKDYTNYENEGKICPVGEDEGNLDKIWVEIEEGEPMELEDNWGGKKCPVQHSIQCKYGYVVSEKIKQLKSKIREFSFELWLKPDQNSKGNIVSFKKAENTVFLVKVDENLEISMVFEEKEYKFAFANIEGQEQMDKCQLKLNQWNHVNFGYDFESKKFLVHLHINYTFQTQEEVQINDKVFKDHILHLGQDFPGSLTEFRFRKCKLSLQESREEYNTPLAIVAQKIKEDRNKVRIKDKPQQQQEKKAVNISEFQFGDINQVGGAFKTQKKEEGGGLNQFAFSNPDQEGKEVENNTEEKPKEQKEKEKEKGGLAGFKFSLPPECEDSNNDGDNNNNDDQNSQKQPEQEQQQQAGGLGQFKFQLPPECEDEEKEKGNDNQQDIEGQEEEQLEDEQEQNNEQQERDDEQEQEEEKQKEGQNNFGGFDNFQNDQFGSQQQSSNQQKSDSNFQDFGQGWGTFDAKQEEKQQQDTDNSLSQSGQNTFGSTQDWGFGGADSSNKIEPQETPSADFDNWGTFDSKKQPSTTNTNDNSNFGFENPQKEEDSKQTTQNTEESLPNSNQNRGKSSTMNMVIEDKKQIQEQLIKGIDQEQDEDHGIKDKLDYEHQDQQQQDDEKEKDTQKQGQIQQEGVQNDKYSNLSKEQRVQLISNNQKNLQGLMGLLDKTVEVKNYQEAIQTVGKAFQCIYDILQLSQNQLYDKVQFIMEAVKRNIEVQNFLLAHTLAKGVKETIDKMRKVIPQVLVDDFDKTYEFLESKEDKSNQSIERIMCPYCLKSFHFRGNKQCSKCNKHFEFCTQTLSAKAIRDMRVCGSCKILYGSKSKKIGDQCSICKLGKVEVYIEFRSKQKSQN